MYALVTLIQGRIQDYHQGGSISPNAREACTKFLNHAHFPESHAHFRAYFASHTELQQLRVNEVQIFAKVSESITLLASILVREGVLLIQMSARVSQISTLNV